MVTTETNLLGTWGDETVLLACCQGAREMGHDDVADRLTAAVIAREVGRPFRVGSDDGGGWDCIEPIMATDMASALEEAADSYRTCDGYDTSDGPVHITVMVRCDATGESDSQAVTIEQDEPECAAGESHDWAAPHEIVGGIAENPGVWGHGGGVKIDECCLRCGCRRQVDTWAQNPQTGEQGLTETRYDDAHYSTELEELRARLVAEALPDHDVEECGAGWSIDADDDAEALALAEQARSAVGGACDVETVGASVCISWRDGATARRKAMEVRP